MLHDPDRRLGLTGEVVDRSHLPKISHLLGDLCDRSLEDNVYYTPRYMSSLLQSVSKTDEVGFAVVWDRSYIVAFLPICLARFSLGPFRPKARAWQTAFTYGCTPLIDRSCGSSAADRLVDTLRLQHRGDWVVPTMNTGGETFSLFTSALERAGAHWRSARRFDRAALAPDHSFEDHMNTHVAAKRRRDLARNRRRLEKLGSVRHAGFAAGEGLRSAVLAFLEMEAGGWKGKRGTALACREDTRKFAELLFSTDGEGSISRADVLYLGDRPIAVSLTVFGGSTGFTVKCTYDEEFASYGAGLLLEVDVIKSFLSEKWAMKLDSGTAGTHVIDGLWSDKIGVSDLLFSFSPVAGDARVRIMQGCAEFESAVRELAKRLIERFASMRSQS